MLAVPEKSVRRLERFWAWIPRKSYQNLGASIMTKENAPRFDTDRRYCGLVQNTVVR